MSEPRWLKIARTQIGVRETVGPKHSAIIIGWLRKLKSWIKDDETPWCGTFVAAVMQEAGLPYPKLYMRAKEWATYGSNLRSTHIAPGAILVFNREGGGHVGFYVGEDATAYRVLGGNQSNAVNVTRILKNRCIAIRWPKGEPVLGGPVRLAANGEVSRNEA
jgi:uncharacterized protein (TIGR02594 family)